MGLIHDLHDIKPGIFQPIECIVCAKTQQKQKHGSIKHHDKTRQ